MTDLTKPVQTKSGDKVRVLCTDRSGPRPVIVLKTLPGGWETVQSYFADGRYATAKDVEDLVNVPEKRWVNVWRDGCGRVKLGTPHECELAAVRLRPEEGFIKTIEIEI